MRLFSRTLINAHGITLRLTDGVKVDFGCRPVLMTQDFPDSPDGNVVVVHHRSTRVSERMEPEIPEPCLFTKGLHDPFACLVPLRVKSYLYL